MLPQLYYNWNPNLRAIVVLAIVYAFTCSNSQAQEQNQELPPCPNQADDVDGDGYGWSFGSCLITVESYAPPAITDPDTGEPAALWRVFWKVEDLHNKSIVCQLYDQHSQTGQYTPYDWRIFYNHFLDSSSSTVWLGAVLEVIESPMRDPQVSTNDLWYLQNGYYLGGSSALSSSNYVQLVGDTFRLWRDQREYWSCKYASDDHQSTLAVFPPTSNITDLYYVRCEDTLPPGDGWGWDGFGSCLYSENNSNQRYVTSDYVGVAEQHSPDNSGTGCDYSNASLHEGWGWNSVTGESCSPLNTTDPTTPVDVTTNCVDSDGDGWGWNGSGSCIVSATVDDKCDYTNADIYDGWGWNPITRQSCAPSP